MGRVFSGWVNIESIKVRVNSRSGLAKPLQTKPPSLTSATLSHFPLPTSTECSSPPPQQPPSSAALPPSPVTSSPYEPPLNHHHDHPLPHPHLSSTPTQPPQPPPTHTCNCSHGAAAHRVNSVFQSSQPASTPPLSPPSSSLPPSASPPPPAASLLTQPPPLYRLRRRKWEYHLGCFIRRWLLMGRCGFGVKVTVADSGWAMKIWSLGLSPIRFWKVLTCLLLVVFTLLLLLLKAKSLVVCRGYGGFGALGHSVFTRELVPRMVEGPWSGKIKHIATSGTHTAAITDSGEVYTWGREEGDGRLGLGPGRGPDQTGGLSTPDKVKALPVPVSAVACGGFCTMALTEQGQLWGWGANSNYELGTGDKVGGWRPRQIPSLENVRVLQVACGGYHSLALTDDGKVLSWGHGGHGQLGHSSIQSQKVPTMIEALAEERIVSIACGGSSSAAVTDTGKLYMWGNAKDSQLGVPGLPERQSTPIQVNFLSDDDGLGPHHVLSVAVGASHAICLVSRSSPQE